jgi:hypothetical protein
VGTSVQKVPKTILPRTLLVAALLCLCKSPALGSGRFVNWTTEDGLPQNSVNAGASGYLVKDDLSSLPALLAERLTGRKARLKNLLIARPIGSLSTRSTVSLKLKQVTLLPYPGGRHAIGVGLGGRKRQFAIP